MKGLILQTSGRGRACRVVAVAVSLLTLGAPIWSTTRALAQPGLVDPPSQRQELIERHLRLGVERAEEGLLREAIAYFQYCIELDSSSEEAYYFLGLVYFRLGLSHLHELDHAMSKVLELRPGHSDALAYRALTRLQLGAFAAAGQDFKALLTHDPALVAARRDLAGVYLRQNKLTEAIETYRQVIDEVPDDLLSLWNLKVTYDRRGGYPAGLPARYRLTLPKHTSGPSPVTFTDVAGQLGVAALSRGRGSAWGDYDGDGDADLFAVGIQDPHQLYRNNGDGSFTEVTEEADLVDLRGGWASLFLDYDRDGDADIFVTRDGWRGEATNSLYRNDGDGSFTDVTEVAGVGGQADSFTAALGDVDNDGWIDIYVANGVSTAEGAPNALYRNRGDATFADIAPQAGVAGSSRSIGSAFGDYDNDGWIDLFVVNMDGSNVLYRNNGDGTFADVTRQARVAAPRDGFVGFFFDYDNDGWLDLFATGWTARMDEVLRSALTGTPSKERNRLALYHNNGDGTFADVTSQAGLARTYGAMAAQYGDVDNDGYLDIYLGTGAPPMDTYEPNKLLWNTGNGAFVDVTESAGVGNLGKGHGATFSDYDHDGDLDLYVPMGGAMPGDRQPNSLYRNEGTTHHWIKLRLVGTTSNPDAVGTRVHVTTRLGSSHHVVAGATGFGSMNDPLMLIGLGEATRVEQLHVRWPSGVAQLFVGLAGGQVVEITEGNDTPRTTAR